MPALRKAERKALRAIYRQLHGNPTPFTNNQLLAGGAALGGAAVPLTAIAIANALSERER